MQFNPGEPYGAAMRLYHSCQAAIRVADNNVRSDNARTDTNGTAECISYLSGLVDGQNLRTERLFCMGDASIGTAARVYVAYMDKHPKTFDGEKWVGPVLAFAENYPCPKK
jgi:hypothetical protein